MSKLKKTELVAAVAAKSGLTRAEAALAIDAVAEVIVETMSAGRAVTIPGVGILKTAHRSERTVRNPRTGASELEQAHNVPKMTFSKSLRDGLA